jgi:hypothetical protein
LGLSLVYVIVCRLFELVVLLGRRERSKELERLSRKRARMGRWRRAVRRDSALVVGGDARCEAAAAATPVVPVGARV